MEGVHIFVRMELRGMVPTVPMSSEGIGTKCGSGKLFGVVRLAKTCKNFPETSKNHHSAYHSPQTCHPANSMTMMLITTSHAAIKPEGKNASLFGQGVPICVDFRIGFGMFALGSASQKNIPSTSPNKE